MILGGGGGGALHTAKIYAYILDVYRITGVLGEGQFGSVSKGIWREETGYILEVAIKSLKPNSDERDKVKFLQEAAIMAQFRHPNVVTLYGVVSSRGTVSLIVGKSVYNFTANSLN